jgi:hypothetical protein
LFLVFLVVSCFFGGFLLFLGGRWIDIFTRACVYLLCMCLCMSFARRSGVAGVACQYSCRARVEHVCVFMCTTCLKILRKIKGHTEFVNQKCNIQQKIYPKRKDEETNGFLDSTKSTTHTQPSPPPPPPSLPPPPP